MLWAWSTGRLLEGATQEVIPIQVLVPTAWLASGFPILDGLCWLGFGDPGAQGCRKIRPCALLPREATKVTLLRLAFVGKWELMFRVVAGFLDGF